MDNRGTIDTAQFDDQGVVVKSRDFTEHTLANSAITHHGNMVSV